MKEIINNLINEYNNEIRHLLDNYNKDDIHYIIEYLQNYNKEVNNIYIGGVGKSSNIALHYATILKSIEYPAFSLSILDCLHGDIGSLKKNDLVFILSKSGNTIELLKIMPFLQKKNVIIIGIFCNNNALLSKYCFKSITLPCRKEIDNDYNLLPSTSIVSFIIFINIVVSGLLKYNNIDIEKYGINHPSGTIGKRIWLKNNDVMIKKDDIVIVTIDNTLYECMLKMTDKSMGCAIILNNDNTINGFFTDGDIRRFFLNLKNQHINFNTKLNEFRELINCNPYVINENNKLYTLYEDMKTKNRLLSGVPVVDNNNKIVGLINRKIISESGII